MNAHHQDWDPVVLRRRRGAVSPARAGPLRRPGAEDDSPPRKFDGEFVKQVVAARTIRGWKRSDLARALGVKTAVVDDLETRRLVYSPDLMTKLKRVLSDFFRQ